MEHWRPRFSWFGIITLNLLLMPLLAACGSSPPTSTGPWASMTDSASTSTSALSQPHAPLATLRVPEDYPTIQAAVNAARAGDLISIGPSPNADGAYHESVTVKTAGITLRGRDRNTVILDGQYTLDDGFEVLANNVVIENMTARHYTDNGFYWTSVTGYRGSYLTAYGNGDYGMLTDGPMMIATIVTYPLGLQ